MRRVLRWFGIILAGLVGLVLVAVTVVLIALHTDWGREKVRVIAEAQLNKLVDGNVALGKITGSVLTKFTVHGITVKDRDGQVALRSNDLKINYRLLSLLKRRVEADEIELNRPIITGRLLDDGRLNLATLWKQQPVDPKATAKKGEPWAIQLHSVRIVDGLAVIPTATATYSLAKLDVDAKIDVAATTTRVDLARLAAIWLERGLPIEAHANLVQGEQLTAFSGVEVVAGDGTRVAVPLGMYRAQSGQLVAAVDVNAKERDVFLFWPHAMRLGDASLAGTVIQVNKDAAIGAHLKAKALGGELWLAAAGRPDGPEVKGELRIRHMSSPLPDKPATIDLDAGFELAGKTITTARGNVDLAARGTVMGRKVDNLKLAAVVGGGVARADVTASAPSAQATLHADVRLADKAEDMVLESARLRADVSDVGRTAELPDVDGDISADLTAHGTMRELSVKGTINARKVRQGQNRVARVDTIVDVTGIPDDPRGLVNVDAKHVVVGKNPLGRIHVRANFPGGKTADVAAAVIGPKQPFTGRAGARVTLTEDGGVFVTIKQLQALARGLELTGKPGGTIALAKDGRISVRDVTLTSPAGAIDLEGDLLPAPARGREVALPTGKMHVHLLRIDLAKMREAFAPDAAIFSGRVTADLHVLRDGRQLGFDGEIVGSGLGSGNPKVPPVDLSTRFAVGHGKLVASGHVRTPSGRSAGVVDFAVSADVPVNVLDGKAWSKVELDEALTGGRVAIRDVDLAVIGQLMGKEDVQGRIDGVMVAAPEARAIELTVNLHGLSVPSARGIDARLDGRWDHTSLKVKAKASANGVDLIQADGTVAAGLHALLAGDSDFSKVPVTAKITAVEVPLDRLRVAFPMLGKRSYGKLSLNADVKGTATNPTAEAELRLVDARVARVGFTQLGARASLDASRIDATLRALQSEGGTLELAAHVDRKKANDLEARLTANKFDLAFLPAVSRRKTDALAGAGGKLDADVGVTMKGGQRVAKGMIALHDGSIYTPSGISGLVTGIEVEVRIDGTKVIIEKLSGKSADGTFRGRVELALTEALAPLSFTAQLAADRFPVSAGSMVVAVSTDVTAQGKMTEDQWAITATARGTRIRVPEERRTGGKVQPVGPLADVVYVDLPDHEKRLGLLAMTGSAEVLDKGTGPAIRLDLKTPGGVRVSGRELDLLLGTNLSVHYRGGEPFVGGAVEANRGFIELFKRRYDVTKANVSFDENERINPDLDIRLSHEFRSTTLYIHVGGTLEKPTLDLSADPGSYDQAQLLGWVLGGDPDDPTVGKRPLGDQAVGLASNMVLGQVQDLVKQALPIDVLAVQVGEGSDTQTTRFEVGKWISESLFVGYIYRMNAPEDKNLNEAEIEYRLGARWLLDAFFGDRGVAGADIIWSKKY